MEMINGNEYFIQAMIAQASEMFKVRYEINLALSNVPFSTVEVAAAVAKDIEGAITEHLKESYKETIK